jgi:hypothetical protein
MTAPSTATVTPPGRARVESCPDCTAGVDADGDTCRECDGTRKQLWRACPRCGDTAFEYINGHGETDGMRCALGCGSEWAADDPSWTIQRLPSPEGGAPRAEPQGTTGQSPTH